MSLRAPRNVLCWSPLIYSTHSTHTLIPCTRAEHARVRFVPEGKTEPNLWRGCATDSPVEILFALFLELKGLLKARRMRLLRGCLSRKSGIKLKGFPSFQISQSCLCTGIRLRCKFSLLQQNLSLITPCPHISGYFWIRIFFFTAGFGFCPHVSGKSGRRIRNFLNPLSRIKIFE